MFQCQFDTGKMWRDLKEQPMIHSMIRGRRLGLLVSFCESRMLSHEDMNTRFTSSLQAFYLQRKDVYLILEQKICCNCTFMQDKIQDTVNVLVLAIFCIFALVSLFVSLISTLYTIRRAFQYHSSICILYICCFLVDEPRIIAPMIVCMQLVCCICIAIPHKKSTFVKMATQCLTQYQHI